MQFKIQDVSRGKYCLYCQNYSFDQEAAHVFWRIVTTHKIFELEDPILEELHAATSLNLLPLDFQSLRLTYLGTSYLFGRSGET